MQSLHFDFRVLIVAGGDAARLRDRRGEAGSLRTDVAKRGQHGSDAAALFADEIQGNIYSRFTNPNVDELVAKLCLFATGNPV